jgi:hypothetical protein
MNHLRVLLGLALIPLCAWIGSCVPIATGNGTIIGLVVGIALSYLFFACGPGRNKSHLPTSYWLNQRHQPTGEREHHLERTGGGPTPFGKALPTALICSTSSLSRKQARQPPASGCALFPWQGPTSAGSYKAVKGDAVLWAQLFMAG